MRVIHRIMYLFIHATGWHSILNTLAPIALRPHFSMALPILNFYYTGIITYMIKKFDTKVTICKKITLFRKYTFFGKYGKIIVSYHW